jgi:hypothetical protein
VKNTLAAGAVLVCAAAVPAHADLLDWNVSPFTADVGQWTFTLGGAADGSLYTADQPDFRGLDQSGATGAAWVSDKLERTYDDGMVISLRSVFEIFHDKLSGDNYGSYFVQKVYGTVQTGLGRAEIGMTDGAAYSLAVVGPEVDNFTSLDNPNATFFVNPLTNRAFIGIFSLNSAVESSLNYAKISYYTPRLFGVQIGASFTPSEGKDVVPFINPGPRVDNRQRGIWEGALSYQGDSGRFSYGASATIAVAHGVHKTLGHDGMIDWAIGAQTDYSLTDDLKLSVGGAYRQTNLYTFDINDALARGNTGALHTSSMLTYGSWMVGGEYSTGSAGGSLGLPTLGVHGAEASVGYTLNTNAQITAGWQQWIYGRNKGLFYDGADHISMDAGFLHLNFHI